ncbi:hypothetical protein PC9H_001786 [Pleurotus ostreatus]|uniref:FAD-binding PCMH-type domain-containing protein n=1 Tax=Pleurotus ostreatus TaxID=5322 RepID=A0A8H6ZHB5_PLEOS|nr:uncharacterized protein PC9H_001786 [Pleurotus ostreatus]KAF7419200.1 hypothetical protein PC9H_001786 [Pleurotus ostreatus]
MHTPSAIFLAIGSLALAASVASLPSGSNATEGLSAEQCCTRLKGVLDSSQVLFPDSEEYDAQEASYYSGEQALQRPACRVTPSNAEDVSRVVKFATLNDCNFAVRSGGHMNWVGSSNIGEAGFTIDLEDMKRIELLDNSKTVAISPGLRWADVYSFLSPHNLHTAGGRSSGVGVGGFLLGGGISFLSLEFGFGSDNVVNYEIVLADGSIVNANESVSSDLYWALKGGSTNYGIVTRFDMATFPLTEIWGGSLFYNATLGPTFYEYLVGFTQRLSVDPHGLLAPILAWNAAEKDYLIWTPNAYLGPEAFPSPLYDGLQDIPTIRDTMRITNLTSVTDEIENGSPGGSRTQWFALAFKANAELPWDIHLKGDDIFKPFLSRPNTSWALTMQPINVGMIAAAKNRGGNPFGLTEEDGDLFLVLISVFWTDPGDDVDMKGATQDLLKWSTDTAKERGLFNRFIYMNYALNTQPVLESFGQENFDRMKEVKEKYDPRGLLNVWKGGYKL